MMAVVMVRAVIIIVVVVVIVVIIDLSVLHEHLAFIQVLPILSILRVSWKVARR